jgi:DNA-binding CsgD family transcriptional regulator
MPKRDLGAVERAFVEAAVDSSRWTAAMETAARVTGARGAALFPVQGRLPLMPHSSAMDGGFDTYIRDGWIERDERYRGLPAAYRKGVFTEFDFTTPEEMDRSPYYQEFLAPQGFRWFAGLLITAEENHWSLSLQRTIAQGPFAQNDLDDLSELRPRLCSAAAMSRALGFVAAGAAMESFAFSSTAIIQLDGAGNVITLNAHAEALIGNGIQIVRRRLVANQRAATEAVERALHNALWNRDTASAAPAIALPRADRRPLIAYTLGLKGVTDNPFADCRALIVLIDPERRRQPPEAVLRSAFRLTSAEARLAARLVTGDSIETVSDALGITKTTARNELRSIFAKVGVHRQAELIALFGALAGHGAS